MCKKTQSSPNNMSDLSNNYFKQNSNNETKSINYASVAKQEVKTNSDTKIPDGWVKLTRNDDGKTVAQYGKYTVNPVISYLNQRDLETLSKNMENRHQKYVEEDVERYATNYIYSWESDKESSLLSDNEDNNIDSESEYFSESDTDY